MAELFKKVFGSSTKNFLLMYILNKYVPMYQVGIAQINPTSTINPILTPSKSPEATGPGCGGKKACMTAKAPATGKA